jgi:hypothetical protein
MNHRSRICFTLAFFLTLGAAAFAQTAPVTAESNGIKLSIVFKGDTAEITVGAPVTGWVAVGFDPSSMMKDANFLIGYVKNGAAVARDDFGVANTAHAEDAKIGGKNDLISFSGTEKDKYTTMTFVIPRDSGDSKDHPLSAGPHTVILGASNSDSLTGIHNKIGKVNVVFP